MNTWRIWPAGGGSTVRALTVCILCIALILAPRIAAAQDDPILSGTWFGVPAQNLEFSPNADHPAVLTVTDKGTIRGWIGSSYTLVGSTGYSGKPLDILVAIDTDGRVVDARLIKQTEPILTIGVTEDDLAAFVGSFVGLDLSRSLRQMRADGALPDAVSGATVSSGVIRDAVIRTGRTILSVVAESSAGEKRIDRVSFQQRSYSDLVASGAVAAGTLTFADIRRRMPTAIGLPDGDGLFSELTIALGTPPTIGRNLLGRRDYERLMAEIGGRDDLLIIAGNGLYSFKGSTWRKTDLFDRVELVQGDRTIRLTADSHKRISKFAADGAPEFREAAVFLIKHDLGFMASEPFRIDLIVTRPAEGGREVSMRFPVSYAAPDEVILKPPSLPPAAASQEGPLWLENWYQRIPDLIALTILLLVLTGILFISDPLVARPKLYIRLRVAFLIIVLIWVGWIAGAQLSVVHVLTFANALLSGFRWELFLLDPMIFLLWAGVAFGLLFLGRGVYCGWLCPFGALQELVNLVAKRAGIKQIEIPFVIHERLWAIKYVIFIGLFGLSLYSMEMAFRYAEIEPFKTAITLRFMRPWPFVLFVVGLLVAGLFIERFYCRYLCPLGAALALPAKLKLFDWMHRRPQCGRECRVCATKCTVQAIHPLGQINPNECVYCLRCQMIYNNEDICVPLKMRARRRAGAGRPPAPPAPTATGPADG